MMDVDTVKALKGSIEKWRRIVEGTGIDHGPDDCHLCQRFNCEIRGEKYEEVSEGPRACRGCPVAEKTREDFCADSPYEAVEGQAGAQAELDFLISLLPAGESP